MLAEPPDTKPPEFLHSFAPLLSVVTVALPGWAWFYLPCWYFYALRCDEGCRVQSGRGAAPSTHGWTFVHDAWQWQLQFWGLAVPAVVAATLVVVLLTKRRPSYALAALLISVSLYVGWGLFYATGHGGIAGIMNSEPLPHPWIWLPLTVMFLGGWIAASIEWRALERGA